MDATFWTDLTSAIDFAGVFTVLAAAGIGLAGVYIARKGIRIGLSMFTK